MSEAIQTAKEGFPSPPRLSLKGSLLQSYPRLRTVLDIVTVIGAKAYSESQWTIEAKPEEALGFSREETRVSWVIGH
jgi:hypothetical protein